jgi:hypothetical protein
VGVDKSEGSVGTSTSLIKILGVVGVGVSSEDCVDGVRDDGEGALLEDMDEDTVIVDSVIGGSLDTDVTTEPVGLKKDVSNDISPTSARVTDRIDGEGSNIEES